MTGKNVDLSGTAGPDNGNSGCRVESIVTMDERGQFVLPKDLRVRAGFVPGDRIAITSWQREGNICCITLTKVEGLTEMVKGQLGPVMKDLL